MPMLARVANGKIHNKDCHCCNDGFWKTNRRDRGKIRKHNRRMEDRNWRRDYNVKPFHHARSTSVRIHVLKST